MTDRGADGRKLWVAFQSLEVVLGAGRPSQLPPLSSKFGRGIRSQPCYPEGGVMGVDMGHGAAWAHGDEAGLMKAGPCVSKRGR